MGIVVWKPKTRAYMEIHDISNNLWRRLWRQRCILEGELDIPKAQIVTHGTRNSTVIKRRSEKHLVGI